jgi:exodeoxyribonuclease V beta subunit
MFASRIAYACERLKLVIDQLDELFVGTLDSFSQNYCVSLLLKVAKLSGLKLLMMRKVIASN